MKTNKNLTRGFTLLELLIVIAILAVLSVALVLVLNPAENLKKSRDTQRMSDMATLKTALGLYLTNTATPILGDAGTNAACRTAGGAWASGDKIFYSYPSDAPGAAITDGTLDGSVLVVDAQVTAANVSKIDNTGWIPVNLSGLTGGSPISNLPLDPVNTIADVANVANTDLVYRYACSSDSTFEIDTRLESAQYGPSGTDDKSSKDGGDNSGLYEVGTKMDIMGSGAF